MYPIIPLSIWLSITQQSDVYEKAEKIRRFTSYSLICDMTETRRGAVKSMPKNRVFRLFSTATRWDFVAQQIRKREVDLRIFLQLFVYIHHFVM